MAHVIPRHQRATGRRADHGPGVGGGEPGAFGREAIDVGRLQHLLPVTAEVANTQVVRQDENDVGFGRGGKGRRAQRRVKLTAGKMGQYWQVYRTPVGQVRGLAVRNRGGLAVTPLRGPPARRLPPLARTYSFIE